MKKTFIIILALAFALCAFCLFSCSDTETLPPEDEPDVTYRVMVTEGVGYKIKSDNPIEVKEGSDAVFSIELEQGYVFSSVNVGEYDQTTGRLVIKNVTKRQTVVFSVEAVEYETEEKLVYVFKGGSYDTTSVAPSPDVRAGTLIKLNAGDTKRIFVGWSFGKSASSGGEIVSESREYEFRISSDIAKDGVLYVYPNYRDSNVFYYGLCGATLNTQSFNMQPNEYYTAEQTADGRLKITLSEEYFNFAECASTFWDDGTFVNNGYLLREYNTEPDGSGEAYSIGSKYFPKENGDEPPTLYCIWEKADPITDYSYVEYTMERPVKEAYAPDWKSEGVIITRYLSDSERVVVPREINGIPVIAIAAGAFTDKSLNTLVLPSTLQKIEDGAFVGCTDLQTVYFPDGIYYLSDNIFDAESYKSFKNLYVNASVAPRYSNTNYGGFAVKLCRVLSAGDKKKIIVIAGSSTYQGFGTDYLNALLGDEYAVINYGTTRTRPGLIYLEALSHYTDSDDIIIYSPENSAYMYGETVINQNMTIDLEGSLNLYRYVDFSNYRGYFTAIGEMNRDVRYKRTPQRYEVICKNTVADRNGDYLHPDREYFGYSKYTDAYYITMNNRIKSILEGPWNNVNDQAANKDYTDPENVTWTSMDREDLVAMMNYAIEKAQSSGAKVYFGFCPADANALVDGAKSVEWLLKYDKLITELYSFDGIVGSSISYVYDHKYFYDCAFHLNDYGRTYRTYQLYTDIAEILGLKRVKGLYDAGTDFTGCKFESGAENGPLTKVEFEE